MFWSTSGTRCDLLVIGGGTAGLIGAKTAASLNASVLLVERDRPGGDCLWTGCVPSKERITVSKISRSRIGRCSPGVVVVYCADC